MKRPVIKRIGLLITIVAFASISNSLNAQDIIEKNAIPKVFLQEGVVVPNKESAPSFTADGKTVYLSDNETIKVSIKKDGKWLKPVTVNISGKWKDWDATLSPDGKTMVFVSNRPLPDSAQNKPQKSNQLWRTTLISGTTWAVPQYLAMPVNPSGISSYGPSISGKGTLCFCSKGRDGEKVMSGYYTRWLGNHYDTPLKLSIGGVKDVYDPFIAPDERYIIFKSGYDLYITYRQGEQWSEATKLNAQVNNGGYNGSPSVSPDGKTLYYSSSNTEGILMVPIHIPNK